jgi:hypothetical protein
MLLEDLLARIYELRPLTCPRCHGQMRLIAFLTEPASIRTILAHLGEPTTPPALAPRASDPPVLDVGFTFAFDQSPWSDSTAAASNPSFHFDQTLN